MTVTLELPFTKSETQSEYDALPPEWRSVDDIPSIEEMINHVKHDVVFADQFFFQESNDPRNQDEGTFEPLYDYQGAAMRTFDENDVVFFQASRGSAKSYTIARWCILWALRNPNQKILLCAPSFRQSKQVFDYVLQILQNNWGVDSHIYKLEQEVDQDDIKRGHEVIIKFSTGSSIEALPMGDGSKIRGRRATVVFCDEFYLFSQVMHDSHLSHFLNVERGNTRPKMIYATTAYYQDCFAYKVLSDIARSIRDGIAGTAILDVTIEDVIESKRAVGENEPPGTRTAFPAALRHIYRQLRNARDPVTGKLSDDALMQFFNLWIKSSAGFYKTDVIFGSQSDEVKIFTARPEKAEYPFVLGVDPAGQGKDKIAMGIIGCPGSDRRELNALYQWEKLSEEEIAGHIHQLVDKYGIKLIVIDKSGTLGHAIAEKCCAPLQSNKSLRECNYKTSQIINGVHEERQIITPWDHPDAAHARAQIVLTVPSDDKLCEGFYGPRYDGGPGDEIGFKNALHISMRAMFDNGRFKVPAKIKDEMYYEATTPMASSDGEILDNIREALAQFPKIDRERVGEGEDSILKVNERGSWYFTRPKKDDLAYAIIYANWGANIIYKQVVTPSGRSTDVLWDGAKDDVPAEQTPNHTQSYKFF